MRSGGAERVLLFLLGSLGDTLVALPAMHLVARAFPAAERRMLTNFSTHQKVTSMSALLDGTDLVQGYFRFPLRLEQARRSLQFLALARQIREWRPDVVVYLHEQRGRRIAFRDAVLFRLLGVQRTFGVPTKSSLQVPQFDARNQLFEGRSEYLARTLHALGDCRLDDPASWDLRLTESEIARAAEVTAPLQSCSGVLAMSIGTKIDVNDWGDPKWSALLAELGKKLLNHGLIALGAAVERERTDRLLAHWPGKRVNLCGSLAVRESAAVLRSARVFIGHDSGPMHLAAAMGTACAAIFSARNPPGRWFPYGPRHRVFYKKTECFGCELKVCTAHGKKCIAAVTVDEVEAAVLELLR